MAYSKARMRIRKRIDRAKAKGVPVKLSQADEFLVLPKYRRLELLAEIALHRTEAPVTAGHRIAAIKEVNLMQHVYDPPARGATNIQILVIDADAQGMLWKVVAGERTLKQLGSGDAP